MLTPRTYVDCFAESEGLVHCVSTLVEGVAPAVEEEGETQFAGRVLLQGIPDCDKVFKRF